MWFLLWQSLRVLVPLIFLCTFAIIDTRYSHILFGGGRGRYKFDMFFVNGNLNEQDDDDKRTKAQLSIIFIRHAFKTQTSPSKHIILICRVSRHNFSIILTNKFSISFSSRLEKLLSWNHSEAKETNRHFHKTLPAIMHGQREKQKPRGELIAIFFSYFMTAAVWYLISTMPRK